MAVDTIIAILVGVMFTTILVVALLKKRAVFGGPPGIIYQKKEKPVQYWLIVSLMFGASTLSWLIVLSQLRAH